MPNSDPHPDLTRAMHAEYQRAFRELKYRSPHYMSRLTENFGHDTATHYIHLTTISEGFTFLWEHRRLDLSVEALVLRPEWSHLFSDADLHAARSRLANYGYSFPLDSWDPSVAPLSPTAIDIIEASPGRIETTTYRILRDTTLARAIKRLHEYKCQLCGTTIILADGSRYAEAHHLKPLGSPHDGPDIQENIICVCPNHHVELDYGAIRLSVASLRTIDGHIIGPAFITYHNNHIVPQKTGEQGGQPERRAAR